MAASSADEAPSPWSRSLTSHTWRIDLHHSTTGHSPPTPSSQQPLAILQLQLTSAPPAPSNPSPTEAAGAKMEAVTLAMDRGTVQRLLAQLDEVDRVVQARAGAGGG